MPTSAQFECRYGTPLHKRVLEHVRERKKASAAKMKEYHRKWDKADESFKAYVPESEVDANRRYKRDNLGKHDYTTITVPYTFAIIMTAHTYWSSVFLSRSPIYQLQGRHGEAQDSVQAFEAVLDYQREVGRHLVPLFNWIFDMAKYEIGIVGSYWDRDETQISRIVQVPVKRFGIEIAGKTKDQVQTENLLKYEGNKIFNVRPHDWYPDPRVSLCNFQQGEFCGRDTVVGWHEILEGKRQGYYFNVEELAKRLSSTSSMADEDYNSGSSQNNMPDRPGEIDGSRIPGPGFVNIHEMTCRIVPQTMGLGTSSRVEKWVFTVANNSIVIGAQPQGLFHDEFPFDVMEFGLGAHEFIKDSLVDIMQPLVDTMSWLINSHFYNVRKALNDVRVVDPSRIVMKDVTSPIERGIVRLKPEAYGSKVGDAIHQLTVPDVTQGHLRDLSIIEQMLQRVTGVVDELMGMSAGPSRESATGVRTRTGYAANRLKTVAEYNSALGMAPLLGKLISNTQQLMNEEMKYRIAGADGMRSANSFTGPINKDKIAGRYDYVAVDGSLPVDRLAQANFWKELVIQLSASPLAGGWNLMEMVAHIMRLQGEKNIDRFRLDLQSPDQIERGVDQGNLVELGGQGGGGSSGGPVGDAAAANGTSGALL